MIGPEDGDFEPDTQEFEYIKPHGFTPRKPQPRLTSILPHACLDSRSQETIIHQTINHETKNSQEPNASIKDGHMRMVSRYKIEFEIKSDFESACVGKVTEIAHNTYLIKARQETNSTKPCQWFYFSCVGIGYGNFVISGLTKSRSLFSEGMMICVCEDGEWKKGGENISYEEEETEPGRPLTYRLKFSYRFISSAHVTYFAPTFPYTYSNLEEFLATLEKRHHNTKTIEVITKTYLKNNIYCITVGNPNASEVIVVSARVHPGETVSSFILESFVDNLLENHSHSKLLRHTYLFKIFPMLNPDGVILGHYRLSYTGRDLNRMWKEPSRYTPEINNLKNYILDLNRTRKIKMVIDIHGHSRQKGAFFFGCSPLKDTSKQIKMHFKEFPFLMSQVDSSYKYESCSFKMNAGKAGTMRLSLYEQLKIPLIYTLECSLCGDIGSSENYSIPDLRRIGKKLQEGMALYLSRFEPKFNTINSIIQSKKRKILSAFKDVQEKPGEDSDSNPEEGCLNDMELEMNLVDLRMQEMMHNRVEKCHNKGVATLRERFRNRRELYESDLKMTIRLGGSESRSKQAKIRFARLKSSMANRHQNKMCEPSRILKVKEAKLMTAGLSIQLKATQFPSESTRTLMTVRQFRSPSKKYARHKIYSEEKSRLFMVGPELGCRRIQY